MGYVYHHIRYLTLFICWTCVERFLKVPPRRKERSCLSSHGHTASSTLDLFDTACGTKPERLIDYAKVMKPYPTQEMAEQWEQLWHIMSPLWNCACCLPFIWLRPLLLKLYPIIYILLEYFFTFTLWGVPPKPPKAPFDGFAGSVLGLYSKFFAPKLKSMSSYVVPLYTLPLHLNTRCTPHRF